MASIINGRPLEDDHTLGALTLPKLFLELTERHGPAPALLWEGSDAQPKNWSYVQLRREAIDIARALTALHISQGERIGILMTNSAQFVASVFGVALAGGVAAVLSTFSTRDELEYLLKKSGCSTLLFESLVAKQNFSHTLRQIIPRLDNSGILESPKLPFLRHVISVDKTEPMGITPWQRFIDNGGNVTDEEVLARAKVTSSADPGVLFFSSGSTNKPKGVLSSHRGVCVQMWRMQTQQGLPDGVRSWTANGFFWSGNFAMVIGATLVAGGKLVN